MGLWTRWTDFWAREEPATPLALFRIAMALIVLHNTVGFVLYDQLHVFVGVDHGGLHTGGVDHWWVKAAATPGLVNATVGVAILSLTTLAIGLLGRVSAFVALQSLLLLYAFAPETGGGHDRLVLNALWLLVLAPSTATLSVDCKLRKGTWMSNDPAPAWVRLLIVYQLVIMYTLTGLQKVDPKWFPSGDFSAVYYSLLLPSWRRFDMSWLPDVYVLTQVGTVVTWWWEATWVLVLIAAAWKLRDDRVAVLLRRFDIRWVYVGIGLVMHGVLGIFSNLGPFSGVTLAYYVCLFRHDELVRTNRIG